MKSDQLTTQFVTELHALIISFQRYEHIDQAIVFGLVWASILSSCVATLLVAIKKGPRVLVAVLAAIPAACLLIDSQFHWAEQYRLRRSATAQLEVLEDRVKYGTVQLGEALEKKAEIVSHFREDSFIPAVSSPKPEASNAKKD